VFCRNGILSELRLNVGMSLSASMMRDPWRTGIDRVVLEG